MKGTIYRIAGPVVMVKGMDARMYDVIRVGTQKLMGEVIKIDGELVTVQVYEETSGIKPGEPAENTGEQLSAELGPGLLRSIYDGIQRPLDVLKDKMGDFIDRGVTAPGLDRKKKWTFKPVVKKGDKVSVGSIIGEVEETKGFVHRILCPERLSGVIKTIKAGEFTVEEPVCVLSDGQEIPMMQRWPVRKARSVKKKLAPDMPLITGQRVFDVFFPLAKGGTAAIPGPFGAGKCVTGDTKIFVNNKLCKIQDVFADAKGTLRKDEHETFIELDEPLSVWSFNGQCIEQTNATHVYKGKTSCLIKIKTRSGREVELTPVHKLFKLNEQLAIEETEAQQLAEGNFIISPRKVGFEGSYQPITITFEARVSDEKTVDEIVQRIDAYAQRTGYTLKKISQLLSVSYDTFMNFYLRRTSPTLSFVRNVATLTKQDIPVTTLKAERDSYPVRIPTRFDEEFAEFLGYVMGDGMIKGEQSVHFFNKNAALRLRFQTLLKKLFNLDSQEYYAHTVEAVMSNSVVLVRLLHSLGVPLYKKSRNVDVPYHMLSSPDSVLKSFVMAYISCDGHVGKKELEITTASKNMRDSLSYVLLRLGVFHRLSSKQVKERPYYRVSVPKREAIKIHPYYQQETYYNSNDIVPMTSALFRNLLGEMKPSVLEHEGISCAAYYVNQNMTAKTVQKVAQYVEKLQALAQALDYVYCDEIVLIEVINKETDVYDITVPTNHNFVGGNAPMILHNTVSQQQLAKWCNADIIVYVGCGERGNEMTEVLTEFPHLKDPRSGLPLMNRTVLIANTSNMPVAAREASIYTGVTIAEYFRDMGYDVAIMADSTSRWAEAMREISSRLEEMPGEEGYPAYLATRLAEFYERAGPVINHSGSKGSLSIIGAVSPPGGDFSEPVTQNTLRVTKTFWALDAKLAQRRHFPSINWLTSYSLYLDALEPWFAQNVASEWRTLVSRMMNYLQEEEKLLEIVQLVGSDSLPEKQQLVLEVSRLIREFLLQQNAFHEIDTYSPPKKSYLMITTVLLYADAATKALEQGVRIKSLLDVKSKDRIGEAKFEQNYEKLLNDIKKQIESEIETLAKGERR